MMMLSLRRRSVVALCVGGLVLLLTSAVSAAKKAPSTGLYPDLRTVVPTHLQIVNKQQQTILRFSNGIANTGAGQWRLRPEFQGQGSTTVAVQEILDAGGKVVEEHATSVFEFHPAHNHWHIGDIALFEVRAGGLTGEVVGKNSLKVTFCLVDSYRLEGNSPSRDRAFWDCAVTYQGISAGWVDQYHQSTAGQQLNLTGAAPGLYYLVSTANYAGVFHETDHTNNSAWVSFMLDYDKTGNAKITLVDHSLCDTPALCGVGVPNR